MATQYNGFAQYTECGAWMTDFYAQIQKFMPIYRIFGLSTEGGASDIEGGAWIPEGGAQIQKVGPGYRKVVPGYRRCCLDTEGGAWIAVRWGLDYTR